MQKEKTLEKPIDDVTAVRIKEQFWNAGPIIPKDAQVHIRKIEEDKAFFLALQNETSMMKYMLKEESFQKILWDEHIREKSFMFTVEVDGTYAGFCGIHNLSHEKWEIGIELLKKFQNKGIGYLAVGSMLDELKSRLGAHKFSVKIEADNYASQRLFEKLGAVPFGIAKYILFEENDIFQFEEENMAHIDENIIQTAKRFGVEPRKLLSHVLEYTLEW